MEILYFFNLVLIFSLQFVPAWFSMRLLRLPPVNPFTILLAISLPVELFKIYAGPLLLIDDGLFDESYQFAVLMANLLLVSQTLSLVIFYRIFLAGRIDSLLPYRNTVLTPRDLKRAEWFFITVYLLALYMLASAEYGVINWISNPRTGYQLYRTGQGHWYGLAISMLSVAMVLSGLRDIAAKHLLKSGLIYLLLGYFLGSKSMLLMIFSLTLIFLWFARWTHLKKALLLGAPFIFTLLVWNLYLALAEGFGLQTIVSYFDHYKNAADYYREYLNGRVDLFYGEVASSSLWAYAPRALVPDKPVVYGVLHINEIFYPGQAELTNTPAFGGAVAEFADFGIPGVFLHGLFSVQSITTALLSYLIFRRPGINFERVTLASVLLVIVQFSPGFGFFFPGALYLVLLLAVALMIKTLRRRRRRRASAPLVARIPSAQAPLR